MKTAALAAFIQGRNMRFAGAPVTLAQILKMWQLPYDGTSETIDGTALEGVARYCKMTNDDLTAAVEAMQPPERPIPSQRAPVPLVTFATVTIPPVARPEPTPEPEPIIIEASKPAPDPTTVIPEEQLSDLVAASRKSSPVIEAPTAIPGYAKAADDDDEVEISFDEIEATPIPEDPEAASATTVPDAPTAKSKKKRKKKS